jgi:hypothetical protein
MIYFENGEQPELTDKDLKQILLQIFGEVDLPSIPSSYLVENAEQETRLKFNAPTPVTSFDLLMIWIGPKEQKIRAHVLYWEYDRHWEVMTSATQ